MAPDNFTILGKSQCGHARNEVADSHILFYAQKKGYFLKDKLFFTFSINF